MGMVAKYRNNMDERDYKAMNASENKLFEPNNMKKEFAVRTLKRIKEIQQTHHNLKALGIDLIDYENGINLLEESIALMFTTDENNFEKALNDVQWWLYDNVDKIININYNDTKVDVNTPEAFIDWLEKWYKQF
jgi:hypothetical protein